MKRIITISREFGSGGRTIGKMVAEKLGIPCYDAEIIQKMADENQRDFTKQVRWMIEEYIRIKEKN